MPAPASTAASAGASGSAQVDGGGLSGWFIALFAGLAVLLGIGWLWRRANPGPLRAAPIPVIEKPRTAAPSTAREEAPHPAPELPDHVPLPAAAPETAAPPPSQTGQPQTEPSGTETSGQLLALQLHPLKLSLTLMNAALSYRLEIANHTPATIEGLAIRADMIAAHASLDRDAQLAGPPIDLPSSHSIERLEPGESRIVQGEFRLPFSQIVPIRQGSAVLLLPLARFRVDAHGAETQTRVFVVGQPGMQPDAALIPFRLDQGPRIYPHLAQRAFA